MQGKKKICAIFTTVILFLSGFIESDVFKEGDEFFGGQQIFDLFTEVGKTVPQVNYTSNFAEALEMSKNSMANILLNDEDPAEVLKAEKEEMKAKFGK